MLPLSQSQAREASKWLKENFEQELSPYILHTKFSLDLVCGIFCQETASKLIFWIDEYEPEVCLARCVFDASGDYPGTSRSAFPRNRTEFEHVYGKEATDMLVEEANLMRAMPQATAQGGWKPANYLYKGYGIFQYDLQHVKDDADFFLLKKWYSFQECASRLVRVLTEKAARYSALHDIVRSYNGSGPRAEQYAVNVLSFAEIASTV